MNRKFVRKLFYSELFETGNIMHEYSYSEKSKVQSKCKNAVNYSENVINPLIN